LWVGGVIFPINVLLHSLFPDVACSKIFLHVRQDFCWDSK
jgi:hypothetical protein